MDRITRSLFDEFTADFDLARLQESKAFEAFCGYLVTTSHYGDTFSLDDICVGEGGDCGIDCICILVNGCLVCDPEEIEDIANISSYLDVTFIFVQAERSPSFEASKIGQFGFGVVDFFSDEPSLPQNEGVANAARIADEIFARSSRFKKGNPQCFLYYATTGRWVDDANLVSRRDAVAADLLGLSIFRRVEFSCLGAEQLQELYRQTKNAARAEIVFADRTVVPELPGVDQAYLGLLPATEFLKLLENDNQEMRSSIFYDNVRAWQDWNPVNTGMKDTLENDARRLYFPLMNNGVTIVARQIIPTGNRFVIEDYQVVNGCQTSYVLHETRSLLSDQVFIPIRLIATQDAEIKNAIIKATNRQTMVTDDQLFALSDFPKKLEAYFPTFEGRKRLYYERRSRQYSDAAEVEKVRIIDMRTLVRAFASMFLEMPHRTTRNYRGLLKSVGASIFSKDHRLEPYYTSAYAQYRLEFLFRNQSLPAELKPARYHLLLAFRLLAVRSRLPALPSRDMARFCDEVLEVLWDDERSRSIYEEAADHILAVANGNLHRDNIRTEPFTQQLKNRLQGQADEPQARSVEEQPE